MDQSVSEDATVHPNEALFDIAQPQAGPSTMSGESSMSISSINNQANPAQDFTTQPEMKHKADNDEGMDSLVGVVIPRTPVAPPSPTPVYGATGGEDDDYLYCCHYKNDKSARTLVINEKPTEPHFVHVQCAAWIPDIDTSQVPFTTSTPKIKAELGTCTFCNARFGFQVHCSHVEDGKQCETTFHPMCAIRYKFVAPPPTFNTKYHQILCPKHASFSSSSSDSLKRRRATESYDAAPLDRADRRQTLPFRGSQSQQPQLQQQRPSFHSDTSAEPIYNRPASSRGGRGASMSASGMTRAKYTPGVRRAGRLPRSLMDDGSEMSSNDDAIANMQAKRGRGRGRGRGRARARGSGRGPGRPRRIMPTDDFEDASGHNASRINSLSSNGDEYDMVIDNGHVDAKYISNHSTSDHGAAIPRDRISTPLENLASLADMALNEHSGGRASLAGQRKASFAYNGQSGSYGQSYRGDEGRNPRTSGSPLLRNDDHAPIRRSTTPLLPSLAHPPPQLTKRPTIRIKPFANPSNTPLNSVRGLPHHPLSAGSHAYVGSSGIGISPSTAEPITTASISPRPFGEQETWIKESHIMLQKQNSMLSEIREMLKSLNSQPELEAKKAMSTISSLSALVSGANSQAPSALAATNGTGYPASKPPSPDISKSSESSNLAQLVSPKASGAGAQFPKPALRIDQLYNKSNTADKLSSATETLPTLANNAPPLTGLQFPKSSLPIQSPDAISVTDGGSESSVPSLTSSKPGLMPRLGLVGDGNGKPETAAPADGKEQQRKANEDSRKLSEVQAEMDDLKTNAMYLIKRLNMPKILLDMLTSPRPESNGDSAAADGKNQAFKSLVADLRQLGTLSKDNLQEYLRVFVRSLDSMEKDAASPNAS
ncbi:hypothetical protein GGI25_003724 [Coemansia spiralis]|uniref:PHD-type domain-containing protein n=1 Tax=Coemansia spiralis TaxID=417178 RepID=A0A9W8G7Z3_9FUNG|nr:hypothetical protein GGI25_003724 [Coemansia spiralis]